MDKIDIECNCGAQLQVSLEDIAKRRTVRCNRGHSIRLVDEGGGVGRATRSMDKFEQSLRDFGK
jgi:hypothetical protein